MSAQTVADENQSGSPRSSGPWDEHRQRSVTASLRLATVRPLGIHRGRRSGAKVLVP